MNRDQRGRMLLRVYWLVNVFFKGLLKSPVPASRKKKIFILKSKDIRKVNKMLRSFQDVGNVNFHGILEIVRAEIWPNHSASSWTSPGV